MKVFGISVLIFLIIIESSVALFKVTNIKCKCYDHSFCEFPQCELKVLGRGKVGIFIYAKMNQLPLKEVMVGTPFRVIQSKSKFELFIFR